jgi:hypothetical protein
VLVNLTKQVIPLLLVTKLLNTTTQSTQLLLDTTPVNQLNKLVLSLLV